MILPTLIAHGSSAAAKPAGGAALDQVAIATGGATVVTLLLLWLISGHRSGRTPWLARAGAFAARKSGLPGWAALPSAVAAVSLVVALVGMYWDIALHIDLGRDEGPLANPAHYLILAGLYGVFAAGALAIALPRPGERPGPAALRVTRDWHAPVGGVLMAACGAFALIGFPLDDVWHRLFGQDVTLWGPTHLMLIGGAGMTLVGQAVLLAEGMRARAAERGDRTHPRDQRMPSAIVALRRAGIVGGFLIGLSTFQAEFDFGVPQFRLVFQPFLIALAAGVALVAGRIWIGPGGALAAAAFFLIVRGAVSVLVGPVLGETTPSLPLYLGSAVAVELVAIALVRRHGALAFGALAGLAVGTVGFATEYAWSQVAMRLPWTADLLPEGLVLSIAGGLAGGVVGALLASGLRSELPRPAVARGGVVLAGVVVAVSVAAGLQAQVPDGVRAQVDLSDVRGGDEREAVATVRIDPASAGDGNAWLTATAWQGDGLVVDRLERVGDGVYRSTRRLPLHGDWKTMIRLHDGQTLAAVPVYLPEDPAIPAPAVPALRRFERPFGAEIDILQRERKDGVAGWLWATASAVVLALYVLFLAALAWGVGRLARAPRETGRPPGSERRVERGAAPARARVGAPA
jgi:hypothetical protein